MLPPGFEYVIRVKVTNPDFHTPLGVIEVKRIKDDWGDDFKKPEGEWISKEEYSDLWTILNDAFHPWSWGEKATEFRLPDFRTRVITNEAI